MSEEILSRSSLYLDLFPDVNAFVELLYISCFIRGVIQGLSEGWKRTVRFGNFLSRIS